MLDLEVKLVPLGVRRQADGDATGGADVAAALATTRYVELDVWVDDDEAKVESEGH